MSSGSFVSTVVHTVSVETAAPSDSLDCSSGVLPAWVPEGLGPRRDLKVRAIRTRPTALRRFVGRLLRPSSEGISLEFFYTELITDLEVSVIWAGVTGAFLLPRNTLSVKSGYIR